MRGSSYKFSHIKHMKDGISAIFHRRVGTFDDITEEEAPQEKALSARCLHDFYLDNFGDDIPQFMEVDGELVEIYPKHELKKALDAISKIPRDVLLSDTTITEQFKSPHAWPFKQWGYKGPTLL